MLALTTLAIQQAAQQHVRTWLVLRLMPAPKAAPAPVTPLATITEKAAAALVSLVRLTPHRVHSVRVRSCGATSVISIGEGTV